MTDVDTKLIVELLEESTMAEPGAIARDEALMDFPGWDSMGMVMFISLVTERFGVELSAHDIRECTTPEALAERVRSLTGAV